MAYRFKARSTTPTEYRLTDAAIALLLAEQYATDQAEVTAKAAYLDDTQTICEVAGAFDLAANDAAVASTQHDTDAAFLETNKDEIIPTDTDILGEFGVTGTAVVSSGGVPVFGGHVSRRG